MSDYFRRNHRKVEVFPEQGSGLRRPQLGALSALIAHGTRLRDPAVVALPTGTGKTAVLQLTPFVWASGRVLVLTPSRLVRDQIANGFFTLELLKELGVIPEDIDAPVVRAITTRIDSEDAWNACEVADVVVTTPMSASPSIDGIMTPPKELFDLVLVDEAHHSPAVSYAALIGAFPQARKAFFTATPFRRDQRMLPGKLIYNYPLRSAIEDGTYGRVEYVVCNPEPGVSNDVAIALMAEHEFKTDAAIGLDHRMMVRTDSVSRAEELKELYERQTTLKLQLVHGRHSMRHVTSVANKLNSGELDGVICVDMFGEGVDFPRLKIAALHAPHKSLAVTLQFIGRFARTNARDIGAAKFIAVPQEIDAEVRALFKSGANWQDLVANLSDARVGEEESVREGLASFATERFEESDALDLTIDSLTPYFHAKVYKADREPDWDRVPFVPRGCQLIFHAASHELSSAVLVCQRKTKPKWLDTESLFDTKNLLIIVHYNRLNQLLFINSQEHGEDLYESILESIYPEDSNAVCLPLSHDVISRALRILNEPSFYNLGMRNRELGGQDESYRTLTGPKADRRVSRTDGNTRSRGHVFGGSKGDGEPVTLGVSTLSKLWSNKYGLVPRFVDWCHRVAMEIADPAPVGTGSNLDFLNTGVRVSEIPAPPISIVWPEHVFRYPQLLSVEGDGEQRDLTGLELLVVGNSGQDSLEFALVIDDEFAARYRFAPASTELIVRVDQGPKISVQGSLGEDSLEQFLRIKPPTIFLADFSTIVGRDWYRGSTRIALDRSWIQTFAEFETEVDIEREISDARPGMRTIHAFTEDQFLASTADVVVYDHRTGEVADYISLTETDDMVLCVLAHCKGATGKKTANPRSAASRVEDAYEVAGQIVKCLPFSRRPAELRDHLIRRIASGSVLKRGTVEQLDRILINTRSKRFEFQVCLVQPAISSAKLTESVAAVLASAGDFVTANAGIPPRFWLSP